MARLKTFRSTLLATPSKRCQNLTVRLIFFVISFPTTMPFSRWVLTFILAWPQNRQVIENYSGLWARDCHISAILGCAASVTH
jgi:hypothetical protein